MSGIDKDGLDGLEMVRVVNRETGFGGEDGNSLNKTRIYNSSL